MPEFRLTLDQFNKVKRGIDLVLVGLLAPVALAVAAPVAMLLRWKAGTPVIYRQSRAGLNGAAFEILKFRSMTNERAEDGTLLPDRLRLTGIGRWLRRTSLDEVPQLLNVLRGEMALVGPRPLPIHYMQFFTDRECVRLAVRPGLTGLAQTAGRNLLSWNDRLEIDAQYVKRHSLCGDFRILINTVRMVVCASGVSVIAGDSGRALDVERSLGEAEKAALRPMNRRDMKTRVEWFSDPTTRKHMQIQPITLSSANDWYARVSAQKNRFEFVLYCTSTSRSLAMLGVKETEVAGQCEFYIVVSPTDRGQGFGRTATRLLLSWLPKQASFDTVILTVATANRPALQLYRSLGFKTIVEGDGRLWMTRRLKDERRSDV